MDESEGNPRDVDAPDDPPDPEPPQAPLDEPEPAPERRLSKEVPIGMLFLAATAAVLIFLTIVAVLAYVAFT